MAKKRAGIINSGLRAKINIFQLQAYIEAIEKNAALYGEKNFNNRMEDIDLIEFLVIGQEEELVRKTNEAGELVLLKCRVEKIKVALEEIDTKLFQKLRANICSGEYAGQGFKRLVNEYFGFTEGYNEHPEETAYDNLDIFINGLFSFQAMPVQTKALEPEMVYYQKTPARIVFELVEKAGFTKADIFFDIGSGLGQVAILVNLLAAVTAKGVEFEPAFCEYATACAMQLNLANVSFINVDARKADYSAGTVFFMFTPFRGKMLQEVLEMLRKESLLRKIKVITYGPCTAQVALQSWLYSAAAKDDNMYTLCVFNSL